MNARSTSHRQRLVLGVAGAVALLFVVAGFASGGPGGGLLIAGFAALVLGVGAAIAGQARWAFIATRQVAPAWLPPVSWPCSSVARRPPRRVPTAGTTEASPTTGTTSAAPTPDEDDDAAAEEALADAETDESCLPTDALGATGVLERRRRRGRRRQGRPDDGPGRARRRRGEGPRAAHRLHARAVRLRRGSTPTTTAATPATTSSPATSAARRSSRARTTASSSPGTWPTRTPRGDRLPARPGHQRRRPDRPRRRPLGRLAEGRAGAGRRPAHRLRQRPAQPARRRRPAEHAEGGRRRRDLAAAEQGVPLRVRGAPGRREGQLPALDDAGGEERHRDDPGHLPERAAARWGGRRRSGARDDAGSCARAEARPAHPSPHRLRPRLWHRRLLRHLLLFPSLRRPLLRPCTTRTATRPAPPGQLRSTAATLVTTSTSTATATASAASDG